MKLVYVEAQDSTGIVRLFVHPNAPRHLKQRALALKNKIELQEKAAVDFAYKKKTGKRAPASEKLSYDYTQ